MTSLIRRAVPSHHPLDRVDGWIRRVAAQLATWQRRLRERDRLAAMTDRELRDVGIARFEAAALARKPFWRA